MEFTSGAKNALTQAENESKRFEHKHLGTEHLLLGLIKEHSGVAAYVLRQNKVDLRSARLQVELLRALQGRPFSNGPTCGYDDVIKDAEAIATEMGHNYIGTEHILLGLFAKPNFAVDIINQLYLNIDDIASQVKRYLEFPDKLKQDAEDCRNAKLRQIASILFNHFGGNLESEIALESIQNVISPPGRQLSRL